MLGRCIVAECRGEIVTAALGGINAPVYFQMGLAEQKASISFLIGRELRCVVGGNGTEGGGGNNESDSSSSSGCCDGFEAVGGRGGVGYRIEGIASANPAADLAHLLSRGTCLE